MKSNILTATAAAAFLLISGAAFAQSPYAPANRDVATPPSAAHLQAQLNKLPDACGPAAAKAADNVGLRIQGMDGISTRTAVNQLLDAAKAYAAAGDEEACWHWYDRSQNIVR